MKRAFIKVEPDQLMRRGILVSNHAAVGTAGDLLLWRREVFEISSMKIIWSSLERWQPRQPHSRC